MLFWNIWLFGENSLGKSKLKPGIKIAGVTVSLLLKRRREVIATNIRFYIFNSFITELYSSCKIVPNER